MCIRDSDKSDDCSEASRRRHDMDRKFHRDHQNTSAAQSDADLNEDFFDIDDTNDIMNGLDVDWNNMNEFEFVDDPSLYDPAVLSARSMDRPFFRATFDPNDDDSIRRHYIEREDAEWVGPSNGPKCGSFPAVDRTLAPEMAANTWCAGYGDHFKLRVGPSYEKYGKKDHSRESLYSVVAMDILRSDHPKNNIAAKMRLPKVDMEVNSEYVTPIMVVNFQIPLHSPSLLGGKDLNGPCLQMVTTMILKEKYARQWDNLDKALPAIRQLEEYMKRAPEEKDDGNKNTYRWRWKLIGLSHTGVPWALKRFNGKPALITHDGRMHRGPGYIEMDINVADWCMTARRALYLSLSTVPERIISLAHVIEAREDEHMPEQTLCCMNLNRLEFIHDKNWEQKEAYIAQGNGKLLDGEKLFGPGPDPW
eukprot:TRINITY_DN16525_c0_g1_i2.p1 TRINITY_DN16525_c0_g1~~TRINITY_DN16525_c0_g1_i2.p1  ORF type:complete len:420 (+),score=104.06 TRINITY_DN16525_c0_g1_i2:165-1424(+)